MVPMQIAMVPKENMFYPLTYGGAESTVRLTKANRLTTETKTMIPKQARDLIDLNLDLARTTEFETQSERYLHAAESMFSFALAAGMITVRDHASEIAGISLIRAQRHARAEKLKYSSQQRLSIGTPDSRTN